MRVAEILPGLLYMSPKTHGLTEVQRQALVRDRRLQVVINLWHTPDEALRLLVPIYIHAPASDGQRIAPRIHFLTRWGVGYVASGRPTLVHCYGGRNRSGLLCALIVRSVQRTTGAEAVAWIRERRPHALVNEAFVAYLNTLPRP